jgi:hypothetical protein
MTRSPANPERAHLLHRQWLDADAVVPARDLRLAAVMLALTALARRLRPERAAFDCELR